MPTNMIVTDSLLTSSGLKKAGDEVEVADKHVEKMKARGHLVAGTKEADAFIAKKGSKKNLATKMTPEAKPSKAAFNSEPAPKTAKVADVPKADKKAKDKKGGSLA